MEKNVCDAISKLEEEGRIGSLADVAGELLHYATRYKTLLESLSLTETPDYRDVSATLERISRI